MAGRRLDVFPFHGHRRRSKGLQKQKVQAVREGLLAQAATKRGRRLRGALRRAAIRWAAYARTATSPASNAQRRDSAASDAASAG